MAKKKYYVVWVGRETGIFEDWPTTQKLVAGHPKAKHKSFTSRTEAEAAFAAGPAATVTKKNATADRAQKPGANGASSAFSFDMNFDVHIFCDGGCDPNPGKSGSGVAVYKKGTLAGRYYGLYNAHGTNNTAELNALHESMKLAKSYLDGDLNVQILADSTYAIKAMTTWGAGWRARGWKRKDGPLANALLIEQMYGVYEAIKFNVDIKHVKAHRGTEGNELADRLSILAIKEKLTSFIPYTGGADVSEMLAMDNG